MQPGENTKTSPAAGAPGSGPQTAVEVLAGLNHEIRTAMNGIVGVLDMLLESGLPSSQRELASTAQYSAENLLAFVEAAVDLSAIGERCLPLDPQPFELSSLMHAAIAGANIANLRVPTLPAALLRGDAIRTRQVIDGMLRIAQCIGTPSAIALLLRDRDKQCQIDIEVVIDACRDNLAQATGLMAGPYMGVEVVRRYGRLGLDIEFCRQLASLMGGELSIRSEKQPSHVLCFAITLPLATPSLDGKRLLIIEKTEDNRRRLQALFTRHGMRVDAFASVGPALDVLRGDGVPFSAAIVGADESGLDAEFLVSAIRAEPQLQDLRLVELRSDVAGSDHASTQREGFDAIITTPLDEAAALAVIAALYGDPITSSPTHASSAPRRDFIGRRILVADDNSVNLHVARRMLEKLGCRVDVAVDGREALEMHRAQPYELILMDCQMPGMDGREAASRIRALDGAASHVPVVAVTACATPSERECCLSAGMNDFIAKPLRPQVLDAALTKWLTTQKVAASAAPTCNDELDTVRDMFGKDFAELAALYMNDSPPRIEMLQAAAAEGDSATVAKVAHAFSGSSASIGASGLAALCKDLEREAKAGKLDQFALRLTAIELEYGRICSRIQSLLNQ
ncbi:MAG TPA: response regulator [Noviherbaspirillum sp.]